MNKKTNIYLKIVDLIGGDNQCYTLTEVAKRMGFKKEALNYYVKDLKKAGVIVKIGAFWGVDKDARLLFFSKEHSRIVKIRPSGDLSLKKDTVRGHAYQFVLRLPFDISESDRVKFVEKRLKLLWTQKGNGFSSKIGFVMGDWNIHFCKGSLVCWYDKTKSFFSENQDAYDCWLEAVSLWKKDVVSVIESKLGLSLKINNNYSFTTSKQHYALIKNDLANRKSKEGGLQVRDDNGVLWLIVDMSHGVPEIELINAPSGIKDTKLTVDFFNSVKSTELNMNHVQSNMSETSHILKELALSQQRTQDQLVNSHDQLEYYAKNLESHVKSVQQLGAGVEKLTETINGVGVVSEKMSDLAFLKKNILCKDDVPKHRVMIEDLSNSDKLELTNWMFENLN